MNKNIISSIFANLSGLVVISLIQLISIPLLIKSWGIEYYGEWLILFSLPSYLGLSDLGLGTAVSTEITMLLASNQNEKANNILFSAFKMILTIGTLCLLILLIIFSIPFVYDILNINLISYSQFIQCIIILLLYSYLSLLITLPQGLYRSINQYARGQYLAYLFRTLEYIIFLSVVSSEVEAPVAALSFLVVRIIQVIFIMYDIKKRSPWMNIISSKTSFSNILHLLKPSISHLAISLSQGLISQGIITSIGISLGPKAVVNFSTIRTLINTSKQLINTINLSFWGEFSRVFGSNDLEKCRNLHIRATQLVIITGITGAFAIWMLGDWILAIWTKGEVKIEEPFFSLFLACIVFDSLWFASWSMMMAINKHQLIMNKYIFASFSLILTTYLLIPFWGLKAVPIVIVIYDIVMLAFIMPIAFKLINETSRNFLANLLRYEK